MAGVAGPMLRRRRGDGVRFLAGLAIGSLMAGLFVSLLVYLFGRMVRLVLPADGRLALLAVACLVFGAMDLADRTPHAWRQVPQSLVRRLAPGVRGIVWGVDLGLLVTTQKAVSLVWATIAAVMLLEPGMAPAFMAGIAVISSLSVAFWSFGFAALAIDHGSKKDRLWLRTLRVGSALLLFTMAVLTAAKFLP